MKSKTVIVTGASTGIGKAITQFFLEKGAHVIMNASGREMLEATFRELGQPAAARIIPGDVSLKSTGEELVAAALDAFGSLDVLINNAGVFASKPFLEVQESDLDRFLRVNLKGTFFTTQAAIKAMLSRDGGAVINIGTVLADHAIGGFPASAPVASKGAIHALTRQLAAEFGKQQIRVNTIAPGIIRTPLQTKIGVENADTLAGLHLLHRIGEGNHVAETAWMLANNTFITGATIPVDGGHTAGHHF
ncbi:SDR family oxidoreductase [Chitinophaga sp. Mgbs1]|uniref:SDR family oxidoreductase n=1 Tax=Chitinophaga solisilvae TaxID=1233460 RepID=A0A433WBJ9_9BACT|nr:SDR family oxidoreductase [Chitinophaga solisilvae]